MRIDIAVPTGKMYDKLLKNKAEVEKKHNARILAVDETKCSQLMLNNRVSAALLNPIGYGQGVKIADYRIIPGPGLAGFYYTGLASIVFRQGLKEIETLATPYPNDFIVRIGLQILRENYGMNPVIIEKKGDLEDIIKDSDAAIIKEKTSGSEQGLDICEEWYLYTEKALPLSMWVCRAEEYPENIIQIVKDLAENPVEQEEQVSETFSHDANEDKRIGKIIRHWNDEFEDGLEYMLQFLFFLQFIPEIAGVKVLGREDDGNTKKTITLG